MQAVTKNITLILDHLEEESSDYEKEVHFFVSVQVIEASSTRKEGKDGSDDQRSVEDTA